MACCCSACRLSARWDRLFPSDPLRRPSIHPRSPTQPDGVAAPTPSPTMAPCSRDLGRSVLRMALVFTFRSLATIGPATSPRTTPQPAASNELPNALSTRIFRIFRRCHIHPLPLATPLSPTIRNALSADFSFGSFAGRPHRQPTAPCHPSHPRNPSTTCTISYARRTTTATPRTHRPRRPPRQRRMSADVESPSTRDQHLQQTPRPTA